MADDSLVEDADDDFPEDNSVNSGDLEGAFEEERDTEGRFIKEKRTKLFRKAMDDETNAQ